MLNAEKNGDRINSKLWLIRLGSEKEMDSPLLASLLVSKGWQTMLGHSLYFCYPADFKTCSLFHSCTDFMSSAHFHGWQSLKCKERLCCYGSKKEKKKKQFHLLLLHSPIHSIRTKCLNLLQTLKWSGCDLRGPPKRYAVSLFDM